MTRYELSGLLLARTVYGWTTLLKSDPIGALARRMKWLSKPRVITRASQPLQCPDRQVFSRSRTWPLWSGQDRQPSEYFVPSLA